LIEDEILSKTKMETTPHPGKFISREVTDVIRTFAADAEQLGELHPMQLAQIYQHRFFHLFVPKEKGGLELSLPEGLRIEESLSWADGSTGWTVTLCAGANWFIGFLSPNAANEIFYDQKACLAGSGKPSGKAKIIGDNFEITGKWKYVTGAPHATIFTANCIIEDEQRQDLEGSNEGPMTMAFWFKRQEVMIHRDWDAMGMIATASHSIEVNHLRVPKTRTFIIEAGHSYLNLPIYKFPFLQFAESTLAVNVSGMAICFLDLLGEKLNKDLVAGAEDSHDFLAKEKLQEARLELDEGRTKFYATAEEAWKHLIENGTINDDLLQKLSNDSIRLSSSARRAVDELFPYCGMEGANNHSSLNRVWRNLHTASQHVLLRNGQSLA
jgi:alkylation response protein AidB-like acyl-CoA dehydrogenase